MSVEHKVKNNFGLEQKVKNDFGPRTKSLRGRKINGLAGGLP